MKTDWNIKCPHCGHSKEYFDDDWMDELIDTSDYVWIKCDGCEEQFAVETEAEYTFTPHKEEDL